MEIILSLSIVWQKSFLHLKPWKNRFLRWEVLSMKFLDLKEERSLGQKYFQFIILAFMAIHFFRKTNNWFLDEKFFARSSENYRNSSAIHNLCIVSLISFASKWWEHEYLERLEFSLSRNGKFCHCLVIKLKAYIGRMEGEVEVESCRSI